MTTLELRSRLHALIDSVRSDELLQRLHDLLSRTDEAQGNGVWARLTEEQRQRVLTAYDRSFQADRLKPTDQVIRRPKE